MPKVVITSRPYGQYTEEGLGILRAAGCEVAYDDDHSGRTEDEMVRVLCEAQAAIIALDPFTEKVFAALPRFKVIGRMGVGYDTIDVPAATRHGVAVCTARGANHEAVADFAFALMLAASRRLIQGDRVVREGRWDRLGGLQFSGKTLGIVGLGLIGKESAKRGAGFGMRLLGTDIKPDQEFAARHGVTFVPFDELLRESDFVTLHVPLDESTRKLIGERQLRLMKRSAVLVNTSRGPVVDENALFRALSEGWIRGAGLDVFEREPLGESPLVALDNVVLAPHEAGTTEVSWERTCRLAAENVARVLTGRRPLYAVNPEAVEALSE